MRFLITLAALVLVTVQPSGATTVCPSSAFIITFEPNSTALTSEARDTLAAAHNRSLTCETPAFTLLSNGDDPLGRDRSRSIRAELTALGVPATVPIHLGIDEPSADGDTPRDRVAVFLEHND